jgi:hypothetical protein
MPRAWSATTTQGYLTANDADHTLAPAIQAAETILRAQGYPDLDRSLEVLHVATEDAFAVPDAPFHQASRETSYLGS